MIVKDWGQGLIYNLSSDDGSSPMDQTRFPVYFRGVVGRCFVFYGNDNDGRIEQRIHET